MKSQLLFNFIAPIYGLFYKSQKTIFNNIINEISNDIDILSYETIIDIGCGTGALCSVLAEKGMLVTGVDPAKNMLKIAKNNNNNKSIKFTQASVLKVLPFKDKSFDIAISSYVAHGLKPHERKHMYKEMSRVAKNIVIIHDYNEKKGIFTSVIEWLEGGNYFYFIKNYKDEMDEAFSNVDIVNVDIRANWYICRPK
ncbi:class I SAM-dependent methyltransferase [Helicovermis profundi]